MTTEQIIAYLRKNKDILNISGIARAAGFPALKQVVNGSVDGRGYAFTFPEKYREPVAKEIERLRK